MTEKQAWKRQLPYLVTDNLKHLLVHDTTVYVVLATSIHTVHLNSTMLSHFFFFKAVKKSDFYTSSHIACHLFVKPPHTVQVFF